MHERWLFVKHVDVWRSLFGWYQNIVWPSRVTQKLDYKKAWKLSLISANTEVWSVARCPSRLGLNPGNVSTRCDEVRTWVLNTKLIKKRLSDSHDRMNRVQWGCIFKWIKVPNNNKKSKVYQLVLNEDLQGIEHVTVLSLKMP